MTSNTESFFAKSSTRVDLAGGTLDLWPLSALVPNSSTLNCSIDCYTKVFFKPEKTMLVQVESPDFSEKFEFANTSEFLKFKDSKLSLLKEAFAVFEDKNEGLGHWKLSSDSPAGSGLGGSSSLLISILKVIFEITEQKPLDAELIEMAKNIESRVLKTPAGIQDYFSPVKKGLSSICYKESGYVREQMVEALSFIGPCLTLVDSQIKHHSGMNNWEILKKFIDGDSRVVEALGEIADVSRSLKEALTAKSFEGVKLNFTRELEARKKVSDSYINKDLAGFLKKLEEVEEVKAFKVCGAGGGGCVLLLHKPEDKKGLVDALEQRAVCVLPFSLIGS